MKFLKIFILILITLSIYGCNNIGDELDSEIESSTDQVKQIKKEELKSKTGNVINEEQRKSITLQWDFESFIHDEYDYPFTKVFIRLNNNIEGRLLIGTYAGYPYEVENYDFYPEKTLMTCSFWFAGAGDDLIVVHKDNETIAIYWREKDEGSREVEGYISDFTEIKQIKITKDTEINIEESISNS